MSDAGLRELERAWKRGDRTQARDYLVALRRAGRQAEADAVGEELWGAERLANTHTVFRHGLLALPPEQRPLPPYHLDGPRPVCRVDTCLALADRFASLGRPLVDEKDLETYDAIRSVTAALHEQGPTAAAERAVGLDLRESRLERPTRCLDHVADRWRSKKGAARLAPAELRVALTRSDMKTSPLQHMAKRVASLLEPDAATAFVEELDQRIVLAECRLELERLKAPGQVALVIARLADREPTPKDPNPYARHFLWRFAGGDYGLITKRGRRWRVSRGPAPQPLLENVESERIRAQFRLH